MSANESANEYATRLVKDFITDITDHVFLSIEHSEGLMREYMDMVSHHGLGEVNKAIGAQVKKQLDLENGTENDNPKSRLIKSYTRHEKK